MLARLALPAFVVMLGAGCSCGPPCTTMSCDGCCDSNDVCRTGSDRTACGHGGNSCFTCSTGQLCRTGVCATAECGAATCNGCCAADGGCVGLTTPNSCGKGGAACFACNTGQACVVGVCMADPDVCDGGVTVTTTQVQAVLSTKCFTACHDPGPPAGSAIAYGDYSTATKSQEMVSKASLYAGSGTLKVVDPRRLGNSSLWLKLSTPAALGRPGPAGENTGAKMPNDGTMLTGPELQLFKDWICSGANP